MATARFVARGGGGRGVCSLRKDTRENPAFLFIYTTRSASLGLGLPANATMYEGGQLVATGKPGAVIAKLHAGMTKSQMRRAEILWEYGDDYWTG